MREIFKSGSVGGAPGNRCFYLEARRASTPVLTASANLLQLELTQPKLGARLSFAFGVDFVTVRDSIAKKVTIKSLQAAKLTLVSKYNT